MAYIIEHRASCCLIVYITLAPPFRIVTLTSNLPSATSAYTTTLPYTTRKRTPPPTIFHPTLNQPTSQPTNQPNIPPTNHQSPPNPTTTAITMFSCVNYERGCRGRCNADGGRCESCVTLNLHALRSNSSSSASSTSSASSRQAAAYSAMTSSFASLKQLSSAKAS